MKMQTNKTPYESGWDDCLDDIACNTKSYEEGFEDGIECLDKLIKGAKAYIGQLDPDELMETHRFRMLLWDMEKVLDRKKDDLGYFKI